jgi:hypothetical protein
MKQMHSLGLAITFATLLLNGAGAHGGRMNPEFAKGKGTTAPPAKPPAPPPPTDVKPPSSPKGPAYVAPTTRPASGLGHDFALSANTTSCPASLPPCSNGGNRSGPPLCTCPVTPPSW